jgi:hypothetical protein
MSVLALSELGNPSLDYIGNFTSTVPNRFCLNLRLAISRNCIPLTLYDLDL